MSSDQHHPDYIIIGGGSAGCVLAARLKFDKGIKKWQNHIKIH